MNKVGSLLFAFLMTSASGAVISMALLGALDTIGTALFGSPIPMTQELSKSLLVVSVFAVIPVAQYREAHISIDLIYSRCPVAVKRWMRVVSAVLTTSVSLFLAYCLYKSSLMSISVREVEAAEYPLPVYPLKLAALAGIVMMLFVTLAQLKSTIDQLRGRS